VFAHLLAVLFLWVGVSLVLADDPVPGELLWTFDPGLPPLSGDLFTEPAIGADGTIYLGHTPSLTANAGMFYALNPDGSVRWSKSFPFHGTWENLTVGFRVPSIDPDGNVYFSAGRILYSYSADGTENWQRSFGSSNPWNYAPHLYPVAISETGRLYLPVDDQGLHELDPADGSTLWSFTRTEEHSFSFTRPITLMLNGDLLLPFWSGDFYLLDKDGETYSKQFSADDPSGDRCMSVSAGGKVFATQGGLYRTQTLRVYERLGERATNVSTPSGVTVPPLIDQAGRLYCPDRYGNLFCLHGESYSTLWSLSGYADQPPILAQDGTLFAVTADAAAPVIRALDPGGQTLYEIAGTIQDPGATNPTYRYDHSEAIPSLKLALQRDGTLIAASNNGKVYAFHGESGLSKSDWPKVYGGYENAGRLTHFQPEITLQPVSGTVVSGEGNTLEIGYIGRPAPTVQWYRNGSPVGSGSATLNLEGDEAGEYHAIVQNAIGSAQTETVTVVAQHRLTVSSGPGGHVESDPPGPIFDHGAVVLLTAMVDPGYVFGEWIENSSVIGEAGSLSVTMERSRSIAATFDDVMPPELQVEGEFPAVVADQPGITLAGAVSDNGEILHAIVSTNGGEPELVELGEAGAFAVSLDLVLGENTITLTVTDDSDLETVEEFLVEWRPERLWSFAVVPTAGEASVIEAGLVLTSPGDVAGANLTIAADPSYLRFLDFSPSEELDGMFRTQSEEGGVLSFTFASLGDTVAAGSRVIGTLRYRVRSLPGARIEPITLTEIDLAGTDGAPIQGVRSITNPSIELVPRTIVGDINNNGRYDAGDAQRLQRLLGGLSEFRAWDDTLNDVNGSGSLDIGDVIVVLRTAAGLVEQPGAIVPKGLSPRVQSEFDPSAPTARVVLDRPTASAGETVTAQVWLEEVPAAFGGASYVLDYPVEALRLEDSNSFSSSPLQPASTLQLWNLAPSQNDFENQTGSISFAAGSAESWPGSEAGGLIAEFRFTVQAGAATGLLWPIELEEMEIATDDGLTVLRSNVLGVDFLGQVLGGADWRSQNFDDEELGDLAISGWDADPDNDGRNNLIEYFAGSLPKTVDSGAFACPVLVETQRGEIFHGLQFDYDPRAIDVSATLELSADLRSWQENAAPARELRLEPAEADLRGGLRRRVLISDSPATGAQIDGFMRLRLSLPADPN